MPPMKRLIISILSLSVSAVFFGAYAKVSHAITTTPSRAATVSPTPTPLVPAVLPPTGINLTVSPVFMNLVTDPGVPVSSVIRVTNQNNFREYLQITVAKFVASENGASPVIEDMTAADDFGRWISIPEQQFVLDPNQTKTVKFTLNPPQSASLGYYYALIVNRIRDNKEGEGAVIIGAPAISVLLEVRSPHAKRELQLIDFKTDSPWYEYLPAEFQVRVKNTGNVHIVPTGDIFLDWGTEKNVAIMRANEARGNVLPQSERVYTASWNDGFIVREPKKEGTRLVKDSNGKQIYKTSFDFSKANKFRIGKYNAHLLLVYDNGKRDVPVEATVSFWVFPWKIMLAAAVILYFILIGIKNTVFSQISKAKKIIEKR